MDIVNPLPHGWATRANPLALCGPLVKVSVCPARLALAKTTSG